MREGAKGGEGERLEKLTENAAGCEADRGGGDENHERARKACLL